MLPLGCTALSDNDLVHSAIKSADLIINIGHDISEKPPFIMEHNKAPLVLHLNFTRPLVDPVYFPHLVLVGGDFPSLHSSVLDHRLQRGPTCAFLLIKDVPDSQFCSTWIRGKRCALYNAPVALVQLLPTWVELGRLPILGII